LQPTALVHEAWLRLFGGARTSFATRAQFFAAAAQGMRNILIDRARRKNSLKRGSGAIPASLDDVDVAAHADEDTLLLVNEALERLQTEDPDAARFVELRFFAGLNNAEAAQALGLTERTARRHWTFARAWLYQEIRRLEQGPAGPANQRAACSTAGELALPR
jgi:RNA polymerase sigma factor (TIGR02999 family)